MARESGRAGRLYAGIASGGLAEPIAALNKWSMNFNTDQYDVTAWGDTNKQYVVGFPDAKGTYAGFLDTATAQTYTAATDGVARKVYLYTNTTNNTTYWFGTAFLDFAVDVPLTGPSTVTGNLTAASPMIRVG